MELHTEVLIIGAGPAGSAAALAARKLNLRSILIEREEMPRDKVCGDRILLKDVTTILTKLDVDVLTFIETQKLHQPSFFALSGADSNKLEAPIETVIVKRKEFDNFLWNCIEENKDALKFDQVKVERIEKKEGVYQVGCVKNEQAYTIYTHYIVGADGYASYVRRNLFNDIKFNRRVASRFYMKTHAHHNLQTAMYFEKEISPGYFWCFKINETTYNTGVYLAENATDNIYETHRFYLKKHFNEDLPKSEFKTWPIPYNTRFDHLVNNHTLLTGDAAGLCDKMFGHGIDNAITSGYLAILSIKDSLRDDIHYPLKEIYAYNLNNYIGDTLRKSVAAYEFLEKNPQKFLDVIQQYV